MAPFKLPPLPEPLLARIDDCQAILDDALAAHHKTAARRAAEIAELEKAAHGLTPILSRLETECLKSNIAAMEHTALTSRLAKIRERIEALRVQTETPIQMTEESIILDEVMDYYHKNLLLALKDIIKPFRPHSNVINLFLASCDSVDCIRRIREEWRYPYKDATSENRRRFDAIIARVKRGAPYLLSDSDLQQSAQI